MDQTINQLLPVYCAGIDTKALKNKKLHISSHLVEVIKNEGGLIWLRNAAEIIDFGLEKFSKSLKTTSFILSKLNDLSARSDSTQVLKAITEPDQQKDLPQKYLIFIDKAGSKPLATYEVRILKSFIQTVGTIYENMLLYHRLLETYKIRDRQAVTDELTSVYNYRYLMRELQREINRAQRFNMPFSVIMFDIDHFKNYNDVNGHPMGDKLLKKLALMIQKNTRKTDTVARYGGEEFLIVLPGLNKARAISIAHKIQQLVESEKFEMQEKQPNGNLTISLGLASFPEDSKELKGLIDSVDKALYRAKNEGRNQIVVWNEHPV